MEAIPLCLQTSRYSDFHVVPVDRKQYLDQQKSVFSDCLGRGKSVACELLRRSKKSRSGHAQTKKKIPWLLGKMFESRSLHVSGGEEG